jgi:hypothetical protein
MRLLIQVVEEGALGRLKVEWNSEFGIRNFGWIAFCGVYGIK